MAYIRKIINDPVYGFITIDHPLVFDIISHPYYQRLRRIHQMALSFRTLTIKDYDEFTKWPLLHWFIRGLFTQDCITPLVPII
jgi:hypothetical protein